VKKIKFVDTTVRDGQQSLWATGMHTEDVLAVMEHLDQGGFDAIEILATSFEKKMARELYQCPFERLRLAHQLAPNTPLRVIRGRYLAAFQITPLAIERLWYQKLAEYGVRQVRSSDASNTVSSWKKQVDLGKEVGIDTILNLVFSISPKHTDEYYAEKARQAAKLGPFRICLKDPGALLTPDRLQTLVPIIQENIGDVPLEFHTHCNTGLGSLCTLEAINLGIDIVNTAIPPLAEGSSNPSVFEVARNARVLGYETVLNEEPLHEVQAYLEQVAEQQGFAAGERLGYDSFHYIHQVPGGMISNLRFQMQQAGMGDRLDEVLEEIARVRADFGYPIMVTPYSQFMGAQAVMNVLSSARYKVVSDELIQYALGLWGEEESESMNPDVRDRIVNMPRAKAFVGKKYHEPEMADLRKVYGGEGVSDDDFLLHFFTSREDVATLRARQQKGVRHFTGQNSVLALISKLSKYHNISYVQLESSQQKIFLANTKKAGLVDQSSQEGII